MGKDINIGIIKTEDVITARIIVASPRTPYTDDLNILRGSSSSKLFISCENLFKICPTAWLA